LQRLHTFACIFFSNSSSKASIHHFILIFIFKRAIFQNYQGPVRAHA